MKSLMLNESKLFRSGIWDKKVDHKKDAEWLRELRADKGDGKQKDIRITNEMLIQQTRKTPNWNALDLIVYKGIG